MATNSKPGFLWGFFSALLTLFFISTIGVMFVAISIMLGKYELITLVVVMLIGALARPFLTPKTLHQIKVLPIIGEATEIYDNLAKHYASSKPKPLVYYMVYPISGTFSFFFSPKKARRELNAYFGLIQWIVLLLIVEGFASYFRVYQYFSIDFAVKWFYFELLLVYFLCNFFAVPVATTALRLSLEQKNRQLTIVTILCFLILAGSCYYFSSDAKYDNLITINVVMDKRIAAANDPTSQDTFSQDLKEKTKMFLDHYGPEIIEFNRKNLINASKERRQTFFSELNHKYQQHLLSISSVGEQDHFFITTTQEFPELWGMVLLPFRDSSIYVFRYNKGQLQIFSKLQQIPEDIKSRWNKSAYVFSAEKQLARVVVDYVRKQAEKMEASKETQNAPRAKKSTYNKDMEAKIVTKKKQKADIIIPIEQKKRKITDAYFTQKKNLRKAWKKFLDDLQKKTDISFHHQDLFTTFIEKWEPTWFLPKYESFLEQIKSFHLDQVQMSEDMNKLEQLWQQHQLAQNKAAFVGPINAQLQKISSWSNKTSQLTKTIEGFNKAFSEFWKKTKKERRLFVIFDQNLKEFAFDRSIKVGLLKDHLGSSPELKKLWYSELFRYFFSFMMFIFYISMPLHILMICYCRFKVGYQK